MLSDFALNHPSLATQAFGIVASSWSPIPLYKSTILVNIRGWRTRTNVCCCQCDDPFQTIVCSLHLLVICSSFICHGPFFTLLSTCVQNKRPTTPNKNKTHTKTLLRWCKAHRRVITPPLIFPLFPLNLLSIFMFARLKRLSRFTKVRVLPSNVQKFNP